MNRIAQYGDEANEKSTLGCVAATTTQTPTSTFNLAERFNSSEGYRGWVERLAHPDRTPGKTEIVGTRPDGSFGRQPFDEEHHVFNPLRLPYEQLIDGRKAAAAYLRAALVELIENRTDAETQGRALEYLSRAAHIVGNYEEPIDLLTIQRDVGPPLLMFGDIDDLHAIKTALRKAGAP